MTTLIWSGNKLEELVLPYTLSALSYLVLAGGRLLVSNFLLCSDVSDGQDRAGQQQNLLMLHFSTEQPNPPYMRQVPAAVALLCCVEMG